MTHSHTSAPVGSTDWVSGRVTDQVSKGQTKLIHKCKQTKLLPWLTHFDNLKLCIHICVINQHLSLWNAHCERARSRWAFSCALAIISISRVEFPKQMREGEPKEWQKMSRETSRYNHSANIHYTHRSSKTTNIYFCEWSFRSEGCANTCASNLKLAEGAGGSERESESFSFVSGADFWHSSNEWMKPLTRL